MDDKQIAKAQKLLQQAMDILNSMQPGDAQAADAGNVDDTSDNSDGPDPMMAMKLAKYK